VHVALGQALIIYIYAHPYRANPYRANKSAVVTEVIPDIVKKRKQTSLLKQSDRFIARTDPVRHMKRGIQMLEKAKTYLVKNEASLLEQAISLV
jgi:hypothetical protein